MSQGFRIIEQQISAGNNFNGLLPTTTPTSQLSVTEFPIDAQGGLFDFNVKAPVYLRCVELKLAGQSTWTVHKRDRNGTEILYLCGNTNTDFITTQADSIVLSDNQTMIVRTVDATGILLCRMSIQLVC